MTMTAAQEVLQMVRNSGERGITSLEIVNLTGTNASKVTGALSTLYAEKCVRREQVQGENRALFRYWYIRERPGWGDGWRAGIPRESKPTKVRRRAHEPHKRDVLIVIPIGNRDTMPLDFEQARAIYNVLREIFGDKE